MNIVKTTALKKLRGLTKRYRAIRGGTAAGKTICILLILIDYAIKNKGREISIVSESIPHLRRGALKDLILILKGLNRFDESKFNRSLLKYTFSNGSFIEFFSTDMPNRLRGARRTDLYINECNNISFDNANELFVRTKDNIWLDWNPTSSFWFEKELQKDKDVELLTLTYKDNESLDPNIVKEIEKGKEKAKTSEYWRNWWMVYGMGLVGSLSNACITDWKEIDSIPEEAELLCGGLVFGYSVDPSAYIRLYKYNQSYIFDEVLYRKGMTNRDISNFLKNENVKERIVADSSEPKSINEIQSYGFTISGVKKFPNSVVYGINLMNQNEIYVTKRSLNLYGPKIKTETQYKNLNRIRSIRIA